MNWLLIVVLLLIVFRVYRGYKKGAIHMILSFSALIISVLLTGFLGPVVSRQLCESEIVLGYVSDAVNESLGIEDAMLETTNQIAGAVTGQKIDQSQQQEAINKIGLPSSINDTIMSGLHLLYFFVINQNIFFRIWYWEEIGYPCFKLTV